MAKSIDEAELKNLLKVAMVEALQEHRDLVRKEKRGKRHGEDQAEVFIPVRYEHLQRYEMQGFPFN